MAEKRRSAWAAAVQNKNTAIEAYHEAREELASMQRSAEKWADKDEHNKQYHEYHIARCEARVAETKAQMDKALEAHSKAFEQKLWDHPEVLEEETTEVVEVAEQKSEPATDEQPKQKSKKRATKKSKKEEIKEETNMTANNKVGARANRVVVRTEGTGYVAEFFKTHKSIAVVFSEDTGWKRDKDHNPTQARESFRTWVQANSSEFGVAWIPELQAQAWDRKYWKYETDSQVEEDAIELMGWTIRSICEKVGLEVTIDNITLDSIVPMESPLSYVENGKYTKNGNWAVAQVNLEVKATIEGSEIDIIYPIEMRSGQLTKIKLTKGEIEAMVADSKVA